MRVGITCDLRSDYDSKNLTEEDLAEFDREDTVLSIEGALAGIGFETERIGSIRNLVGHLSEGRRWDFVFNIAEGLFGFGREAAVPALLDSWLIPYTFSDPMTMGLTLHKGMAKHVMRSLGIPTPDFCVVQGQKDLEGFTLPFPVFAKPVAEGTSKGIDGKSRVEDMAGLRRRCRDLWFRYRQPVLVETYLPGREYTVGLVQNGESAPDAFIMEIHYRDPGQEKIYCFQTKENCEQLIDYSPAEGATADLCVDLSRKTWTGFGLRDAARVDLRLDAEGAPSVMEVNPLPGLHPEHSDLPIMWAQEGLAYPELIRRIASSCLSRISENR